MTDIEYLKKYLDPSRLEEGMKQLEQGLPVQYIVGDVNFYGYPIKVNRSVLIPRFETEELVDRTIRYVKQYLGESIRIADLGTGSGCIAITLKKELPSADIVAVDISKEALDVARQNARLNQVAITFLEGDMLKPLTGKFDLIISNPPYISKEEKIMDIVYYNEPHQALFAPHQGLYYYEQILTHVKNYLNQHFILAFEIGYQQGESLRQLAKALFPYADIQVEQDLHGKDRFLFIIKHD